MVRWFIDRTAQRGVPSVSLRRLLPDATFIGGRDLQVSGCSADPKTLQPGQVFVAIRDARHDGHAFVEHAVEQGAAGIVVERPYPEARRLQVVVPNTRIAHARLSHALAGDPAERLDVIGIAGGRQARLITVMLQAILGAAKERFGHISPEGWSDGLATRPMGAGFPQAERLADMLSAMIRRKCVGSLLELSAATHDAADLTEGMQFDTAVVACVQEASESDPDVRNARRRAYARLVRRVRAGGIVVVNEDDSDSELLGSVNLNAERVSIGINRPADVSAEIEFSDDDRSRFVLKTAVSETTVTLCLGGTEAIHAALAATAVARSRGINMATIVAGLEAVDGLPCRFERIEEGQPFEVRIDPARSAEELATALSQSRDGLSGKVICVIGVEGHGDLAERTRIASKAASGADIVIFTSDNPRSEEPLKILEELHAGTMWANNVQMDPDRRRAIETALSMAEPGDVVVIAGKGRDGFQIFADRVIPFDDRAVAAAWLRAGRLAGAAKRSSA